MAAAVAEGQPIEVIEFLAASTAEVLLCDDLDTGLDSNSGTVAASEGTAADAESVIVAGSLASDTAPSASWATTEAGAAMATEALFAATWAFNCRNSS